MSSSSSSSGDQVGTFGAKTTKTFSKEKLEPVARQQDHPAPRITIHAHDNLKFGENSSERLKLSNSDHIAEKPITLAEAGEADKVKGVRDIGTLSRSSKRLLEADELLRRDLWRAARNYRQSDYYDYSLFGLNVNLDRAVGRHQHEAMLYNQGKSIVMIDKCSEAFSSL